ncbi:MAG: septum formation protein Maf [Spirochaetales bacterium]|nr:septum formation protein Maf [Spirochaetales bacterium]
MTNSHPLLLASASPRRQEILSLLNIPFTVYDADIDETLIGTDPQKNCVRLSIKKAEAASKHYKNHFIVAADTMIYFRNNILGKPADKTEANRMLSDFSGKTHWVFTGFCVYNPLTGKFHSGFDKTRVRFLPLSHGTIQWYLGTGEWKSAAGAYRIQGAGACLIRQIKGSHYTVMGLPIHKIYGILRQHYLT